MVNDAAKDRHLHGRGRLITALGRWLSLGLGCLALLILWNAPAVQSMSALGVAAAYAAFAGTAELIERRYGRRRSLRILHDVVDALAAGAGAAFTGRLRSPLWLLLYPHVVAVSVRGGMSYAMVIGALDAVVVTGLGALDQRDPFSGLYAVSLMWCAFIGGSLSSYLLRVQQRLAQAKAALHDKDAALEASLQAGEQSGRRLEDSLVLLRSSEERYRGLLERIQDGVAIVSAGRIVYVNAVFARMVEDSPAGLVGSPLGELIPPEDRALVLERYEGWDQGSALAAELETELLTRHGSRLTVALRGGSVEWEGRRSLIATVRDITHERRMEREVKAHAARLSALNEIANAANQSLTIEDIFDVAAGEARRIVPFDHLTLALLDERSPGVELVTLGPGARRQRAPFRREDVAWAFRRPVAWHEGAEEPRPRQLPDLLAHGELRAAATLPLLSKERVIGALCLGRFLPDPFLPAELQTMEPVVSHIAIALDNARLLEAVRRRGREFESLVEIGRRIVERLEPAEILPLVARSVNSVLGTPCSLLMLRDGELLRSAAHEGLEPAVVARFRVLPVGDSLTGWVAQEGRALSVPDVRKDPRLRFPELVERFGYCSFLGVPLRRGAEVLGTLEVLSKEPRSFGVEEQEILTAFADVTAVAIDHARLFQQARGQMEALADANQRLEELDRMRQEYLRNVSHEFRTPLTVIRGWAEYLRGGGPADEAALEDAMRIVIESCDRVIDMVDTLIEVSRIEQGTAAAALHVRNVDVSELVRSTLEPLRPQAEKKGVALDLDLPSEPLRVQGDSGLLQQVVRKLVDNAIKHSGRQARVLLHGREQQDLVELRVEDQGRGITPEQLPRIFEKFYMGDGGLTRRSSGFGVGLYLVREIVHLHGGSVDVQSEPGRGSAFTVRLPKHWQAAADA